MKHKILELRAQGAQIDAAARATLPRRHLEAVREATSAAKPRLGQLQGLAVDPALKRRGIASELVHRAEEFVQAEGGRGLYVDTPVTNEIGRSFYEALGYRQAYVMPEYYDQGLDGVTYLKLFPK